MNKRFLIWATGILLAGAGLAFLLPRNDDPGTGLTLSKKELADKYAEVAARLGQPNVQAQAVLVPVSLSQPVRLAIGGLGLADNDQNQQLGDLVTAELTGAPGLSLVERQSLAAILQELNLTMSGFVRAKDAVRVGKLLKADWFLLGTEASFNGTNALVVRVVDARTGIMRDAGVVVVSDSPAKLAADVAAFVRQSRQNAAEAKSRVYLAIGAFEDLSINNRQANFPTQLRGYLTAAYQGSGVTLLEREYVETLLQEVRLDLAGLTEGSGPNPPPPMQSAFWLVSGQYQSYETTNLQVEVNLDVQRIFGRAKHFTVRGLPGELMDRQIKAIVDEATSQNSETITLSRMSEARAQMELGKELANLGMSGLIVSDNYQNLDGQEEARQRRNAKEAIKAFETVLILDPVNREAKLYLAACLRKPTIGRLDEARDYYREVLEESVQDKWVGQAQQALHFSFDWASPEEKLQWYEAAAQHSTNPSAVEFFRHEVENAGEKIILNTEGSKAQTLAEVELLRNITNAMLGNDIGETGVNDFVKTFGTNQIAAAKRLAELYPNWKTQFPELAPYLLAAVITVQVDTNAPVVAEFQQMLEKYARHPDQVVRPSEFWEHIWRPVCQWSYDHKLYDMTATLLEGKIAAAALYPNPVYGEVNTEQKMSLAFAYLSLEQWQKALEIFESYSNRPVRMGNSGPWGDAFSLVFTSKQAAFCRQKLGLAGEVVSLQFDMGKPLLCLCTPSTFIADENGLWIGIGGQLLQLDFDLKTNLVITLPMAASTPITALCLSPSSIWIGTAGEGLIKYNKSTRKCMRYVVNDGLMMNIISCMHLAGDVLWIGYGYGDGGIAAGLPGGGGLGCLNLSTYKFTSFTPSIAEGTETHKNLGGNMVLESTDKPTRRAIQAITAEPTGAVWFATAYHPLRCYHSGGDVWEGIPSIRNTSSFAADANWVYVGQFWNFQGDNTSGPLGVGVLNLQDGQWRNLKGGDGLPSGSVTTLTLDGKYLWVGGMGYVALVDPNQDKVLHYAYVKAQTVDRIQIGGSYVWAQFDWHLYRAALSTLQ